jgi:hypothetical protein
VQFLRTRRAALAAAVAISSIVVGVPAAAGPASASAATLSAPGATIPCYPFPVYCPSPLPTMPGGGGIAGTGLPYGGHGPGPVQIPGGRQPGLPFPVIPGLPYGGAPSLPFPVIPGLPYGGVPSFPFSN